jgi:hypothetical protein
MRAPRPGADEGGRPEPPASRDDETGWDAFVAAHPEGTIFHTRTWARIVLTAFPRLRDASLVVSGEGTPCILPLFTWSRAGGLFRTLHSSFPFAYGGPVPWRDAAGADMAGRLLPRLRHPLCSWRITGNPFGGGGQAIASRSRPANTSRPRSTNTSRSRSANPSPFRPAEICPSRVQADPTPPPGFTAEQDTTHLLALPATEAAYWGGVLTTAQRNDWRRLAKKGVTVEETRAERDADAMYELYRTSFARWGGEPRFANPPGFYRALLAHGGDAVRLTVVRHKGRLAGGCLVLRWNGKAHYLAGYFDREARALRPAALLQIESILRAIRDGYRWYDFLPSGGHASVEAFKASLGGQRTPFPIWTRRGGLHRLRFEA